MLTRRVYRVKKSIKPFLCKITGIRPRIKIEDYLRSVAFQEFFQLTCFVNYSNFSFAFWSSCKKNNSGDEQYHNQRQQDSRKQESLIPDPCYIFSFYYQPDLIHRKCYWFDAWSTVSFRRNCLVNGVPSTSFMKISLREGSISLNETTPIPC